MKKEMMVQEMAMIQLEEESQKNKFLSLQI